MEYLLVDIQQWITMDLSIAPTGMSTKYWTRLDTKEKENNMFVSLRFSIANVSREDTTKYLWDKMRALYLRFSDEVSECLQYCGKLTIIY